MYFIDEVTKQKASSPHPKRVLITIVDGMRIYGYTTPEQGTIRLSDYRTGETYEILEEGELSKNDLIYSNRQGCYMLKEGLSPSQIIDETVIKGRGGFPYSFQRRYEAIESFKIFKNRQRVLPTEKKFPIAEVLKYTFGAEFETSEGYIPENVCFRDGLIPLRDGSISGLEYSTIVMSGLEGVILLDQQLSSLRQYTDFDKECSLHFHFGNFPVNTTAIYNLYQICCALEMEISEIVPGLTFNSAAYKKNGKDYCKFLPRREDGAPFQSFEELYVALVGKDYKGSLSEAHPSDPGRDRKWNITTRYFWVNFINIMCYKVNKTIEFRLLRPSFNLEKITLWLYIFNAMLMFAESRPENYKISTRKCINLNGIFKEVYPEKTAEMLSLEVYKLRILIRKQNQYGDKIGGTIHFENEIFNPELSL